jgi:hypothetical protein
MVESKSCARREACNRPKRVRVSCSSSITRLYDSQELLARE